MSFSFEYEDTDDKKSGFQAWGVGLHYKYDAPQGILDIIQTATNRPLVFVNLYEEIPGQALLYARYLEKTMQVNALTLSNNTAIDITSVLDCQKFPTIIKKISTLADHSFNLKTGALTKFTKDFCQEFSLKKMRIKTFHGTSKREQFFNVSIKTQGNNRVVVRGNNLHTTFSCLSEQVLHELLTIELGGHQDNDAHNMLNIASNLSTLSKILDEAFIPELHLIQSLLAPEEKITA